MLCVLCGLPAAQAQDAAALRARHQQLRSQLTSNQFGRPLHLESHEEPGSLRGDIHSRLEQPFPVAREALGHVDNWCGILLLHLNVKSCRATTDSHGRATLSLGVGRKFDRPVAEAFPFEFHYRVAKVDPEYLQIELNAAQGPIGTRNYRISLEVVELGAAHSFLHLAYAYEYGVPARAAMQGYLATIGRGKVGFTITGHTPDGEPIYQDGTLGVIERNTMRYYIAIEAYLGALSVPLPEQQDKRLQDWYSGVERFPAQLHDLERAQYIDMKRGEIARQLADDAAREADSAASSPATHPATAG